MGNDEVKTEVAANSRTLHEDGSNTSERVGQQKEVDVSVGEATGVYGNIADAEELGYVHRGLKSRHMQFMALGGTIGTALFLGIGGAFLKSGPLSVILGFSITGIAVWSMMMGVGEMVTWLPIPGALPQMCARYVDPAMGFAVGWNMWYLCAIAVCAEISAAAVLVGFWNTDINPAAWISIIIVFIVALNFFAVSIYGEAEFIFAGIKIITILGLLLMSFIVDLGSSPSGDRLGFRYWYNPGPAMKEVVATGHAGRFLGLFSTLVYAAFSYGGVEMVAMTAGEAEDPRRNVPKAIKRIFWRILIFYVLGSLAIGVLVPSDNPQLASASPWVLACQNAGIPVLPHIINAVIISSACSSGNAFLYVGARYLFGLAQNKQAPRIFLKCTEKGVPVYGVAFTAIWTGLTYLSAAKSGATAFLWFLRLGTLAVLLNWVSCSIAYLRFRKALDLQRVDRNSLPYRAPLQPYTTWFALVFFIIVIIFNGWEIFTAGAWSTETFVTTYVGLPIFITMYLFWKIWKRTKFVDPAEADLWTGKAALDAIEWPERKPRNIWEKIWFWIA